MTDDSMSDPEQRCNAIQRELENALIQLRTHPPSTLHDLILWIVQFQTLTQERTELLLDVLLTRVERLERRIESLGPPPP